MPSGSDKQVLNHLQFPENGVSIETAELIKEYLAGKRKCFNIPYRLEGSSFAINVYQALLKYLLDVQLVMENWLKGQETKAAQAVGQIMRKILCLLSYPATALLVQRARISVYGNPG